MSDKIKEILGFNKEELQEIYENPNFEIILREIENKNNRFKDLPIAQKKLALALIMQGNSEYVKGLSGLFYKRYVPTISEFLSNDYIGSDYVFYDDLSPWTNDLKKLFSNKSSVYEYILTGAIGTAKTSVARIAHFYNLYRITSLRYPQLAMGSGETKPMCLMFITVSKLKARELLQGIKILLNSCKYFYEVKDESQLKEFLIDSVSNEIVPYFEDKIEGFPRINFPNNVYIITGSRLNHTIGSDIFGVCLDEAEFRGGLKSKEAFELYSELLSRVTSRFINTKFKLVTLVSSVKHDTGIISTHLKGLDPHSPYHFLSSYAIWEVKKAYRGAFEKYGKFYVMRGTKTHPSKRLDETETLLFENKKFSIPENCKIITIPAHPLLIAPFNTNIERALKEQAGEQTSGGERPFDDLSLLYDPDLLGELTLEAPLGDGKSIFDQLPKELFVLTPDGYRLRRYPTAKRYLHLDLADTGEAALSMVHKELGLDKRIVYVFDFVAKIISPNRISFNKIDNFLIDLKEKANIYMEILSADQYQSVSTLQKMEAKQIAKNVVKTAIGTKPDPFNLVSSRISENCVKVGLCPTLQEQLKGILFPSETTVFYETDRKDMADSFTGSVFIAINNPKDIPSNIYENYSLLSKNFDLSKFSELKEV